MVFSTAVTTTTTRTTTTMLFSVLLLLLSMTMPATGFVVSPTTTATHEGRSNAPLFAEDKLRAGTGIRPSLHPTTINALAETLKLKASDESSQLVVTDTVEPLQVAMAAAKIATDYLATRKLASKEDDMTFTDWEEQTIAGRVVGVVMRFEELELTLRERVSEVAWVAKYKEWGSFGVLEEAEESDGATVQERIKDDPLFCMARAECLLAIFLSTIEAPKLLAVGEDVPGGSVVDFIDADRLEVLMGDYQ